VKLQKQLSRRFAGKDYAKWVVVLPPRIVRELGWKEGQELKSQIDGRILRMGPVARTGR
jgi:antitoxin component of MazEF toxin-antitoxin module